MNWFLEHRLTHWDEEARSMCKSALYAMIHFQQLREEMWGISDSDFGVSLVVGGLSASLFCFSFDFVPFRIVLCSLTSFEDLTSSNAKVANLK